MQAARGAAHPGSSGGPPISSESHAWQPLQVSHTGGVAGVYKGHVAALHHSCHAFLLTPHVLLAAPALLTCWP